MKKLKLLVASALLSSTAVYADDCTDSSDEIHSVSGSVGVMGSF